MTTSSTGPLIPRRRLGAAFRELRETKGQTLQQTAQALMFSPSKLSRIENGLAGEPHPRDVRDLIVHFGREGTAQAVELEALAERGRRPGWWQLPEYTMPARLDTFISYESAATSIEAYVPLVVPGLLQIKPYATEALRRLAPQLDELAVQAQVELRMRRQEKLLGRDHSPGLRFWVPETVLHRRVGTPEIMRQQTAALLQTFDNDSVDLRVITFDAGLYLAAEFATLTHFHFESALDPDVIALELVTSIQFLDGKDRIQRHRDAFAELDRIQLNRADSRAFIAEFPH